MFNFKTMFLSELLIESATNLLLKNGADGTLKVLGVVPGGSINACYRLQAGERLFFMKVNSAQKYPRMFLAEAQGLKLLRSANAIRVPEVIAHGVAGAEQFLLLEWIETEQNNLQSQAVLGEQLAKQHRHSDENFGLEHDNYMGSLSQSNTFHPSCTDFYISERLQPQLKLAVDAARIDATVQNSFEKLFGKLYTLYPAERPALIHGDLWSGNYLTATGAEPVLIDPAVSYGHREMDIAMTTLFGGFDSAFYHSYHEHYPLENGWQQRMDLWNLYPLLVHVNLFGAAYLNSLKSALHKYSR